MNEQALHTLGKHLQALRQARGWSLTQLASAAGIAKSNLSRLEQGSGNPTLDTLWRLATQLEVSFSTLIASIKVPLADSSVQLQLVDQGQDSPPIDVYWMRCAPHALRRAEGHTPGTRETLTLISGRLEAGPEGATQRLHPGESMTFAADQAHLYRTEADSATLLITIIYSQQGTPHESAN